MEPDKSHSGYIKGKYDNQSFFKLRIFKKDFVKYTDHFIY